MLKSELSGSDKYIGELTVKVNTMAEVLCALLQQLSKEICQAKKTRALSLQHQVWKMRSYYKSWRTRFCLRVTRHQLIYWRNSAWGESNWSTPRSYCSVTMLTVLICEKIMTISAVLEGCDVIMSIKTANHDRVGVDFVVLWYSATNNNSLSGHKGNRVDTSVFANMESWFSSILTFSKCSRSVHH